MKNRAVLLSTLLLAAVAATAWLVAFRSAPRRTGPLRHEAYVWQRAWSEPVRNAVAQHASNFSALTLLKAEVSWKDRKPQVTRVSPDYGTLAATHEPVGLALRIGPYAGPFAGAPASDPARFADLPRSAGPEVGALKPGSTSPAEAITTFLCDLAGSLIAEARSNHVSPCELQVDFDCAASKLDGYRVWLTAIQARVAPLPVTITALPNWLHFRAFKNLAAAAPNYVLQVHSLERPTDIHGPFTLCDPRAAQRAVERAGRLGVPFRVALPTYGYVIAFDKAGKFIGLAAEGPRRNWPDGAQLREVSADPLAMATLIRTWTASRPAAMQGVIWYRLPTIVDNFNWRWPTLGAIVAARSPREAIRVEARRVEAGLMEINLVNDGELDFSSRLAVEVRWTNARLIAGDALRDFELTDRSLSAARFQTRSQPCRLRAGDSLTLGWLRFDRDCEVRCELERP